MQVYTDGRVHGQHWGGWGGMDGSEKQMFPTPEWRTPYLTQTDVFLLSAFWVVKSSWIHKNTVQTFATFDRADETIWRRGVKPIIRMKAAIQWHSKCVCELSLHNKTLVSALFAGCGCKWEPCVTYITSSHTSFLMSNLTTSAPLPHLISLSILNLKKPHALSSSSCSNTSFA